MKKELTYSLIQQLRTVAALKDVIWMYDGVTLAGRDKPFCTVEQLSTQNATVSKERTIFSKTYRYQVGLYASSASERADLEDAVEEALKNPMIPFYDTAKNPPKPAGFFYAEVGGAVPITPDNIEDTTAFHHLYFDVSIPVEQFIGDRGIHQ